MTKRVSFNSLSFFLVFLSGAFCMSTAFAQASSVKNLKNLTQQMNDINKSVRPGDPWTLKNIITPEELLKQINSKKKNKPVVLQIGFQFLFEQGHIPGAKFAGPASRNEGIKKLKSEVQSIPHDKEIVIYCGCCGWTECPNIHPAFTVLNKMGFKNIKLLYLPQNFTKDWVNKKLPVVR